MKEEIDRAFKSILQDLIRIYEEKNDNAVTITRLIDL
jgi:hypothetical protein